MSDRLSVFRNRNLALYFTGAGFSLHGTWIQRIAQGWLAWELTESEFWVGMVAFLDFFPVAILAPVFGVIADRVDRTRMMAWANGLMMVNVAALTVFTLLDRAGIELLLFFVMNQGILNAMNTPARLSLVPNLVSRQNLSSALAMMSLLFNVSRFIGPALAGVIISLWGVGAAFAANTLSFLIFAIVLSQLDVKTSHSSRKSEKPFRQLQEGFLYARRRPSIIWSLVLITVVSFFSRGTLELMPAFADVFFARGSSGLAALTSAAGAGAIFGALLLASSKPLGTLFKWVIASAGSGALLVVAFSMNTHFGIALILIAGLGMAVVITGVGVQIIIQSRVNDDYRGRVMSIWASLGFGAVAVGGLAIGAIAEPLGLSLATLLAGIACTGLVLVIAKPLLHRARLIEQEISEDQASP